MADPGATDRLDEAPTHVRWTIFSLASGMSFILYLHRYTWGMVKPRVAEEFDWDYATLSLLDSCFNLSYALGQIPFGIMGDWFGPGIVLGVTLVLWSLSMGATTLAGSFRSMYAARFLFGLMQSGCYSNLSKVTKVWFPPTVRTTVQGFISSFCGRSGGALSNIVFGTVMLGALALPWRTATIVMTVLGLGYAALFFWLFRSSPKAHPRANDAEAALITKFDASAETAGHTRLQWSTALRSGNMLIFLFQQFTSAFADNLYPFWIPLFLLVEKGVDIQSAGVLASLPLFGGAFGGMTGGYIQTRLIARTGNRRWVRSLVGLTGKSLAALVMYLSLGFDSAVIVLCLFAVVKFFSDWSQPTVWGTATDIGGRNSASVFAIVNMSGSLAGFVASPIMGALILYFSQSAAVESVTVQSTTSEQAEELVFQLPDKALREGSLTAQLFDGDRQLADISVSEDRRFTITEDSAAEEWLDPNQCRVHWNRGELTLRTEQAIAEPRIIASYEVIEYGKGWTALFVALSLIYFASAVSWLFIDCTKQLEERVDN